MSAQMHTGDGLILVRDLTKTYNLASHEDGGENVAHLAVALDQGGVHAAHPSAISWAGGRVSFGGRRPCP